MDTGVHGRDQASVGFALTLDLLCFQLVSVWFISVLERVKTDDHRWPVYTDVVLREHVDTILRLLLLLHCCFPSCHHVCGFLYNRAI